MVITDELEKLYLNKKMQYFIFIFYKNSKVFFLNIKQTKVIFVCWKYNIKLLGKYYVINLLD